MSIQVLPYVIGPLQNSRRYEVRFRPQEEPDSSVGVIRTAYSLQDILYHFEQDGTTIHAIRSTGAWHELNTK